MVRQRDTCQEGRSQPSQATSEGIQICFRHPFFHLLVKVGFYISQGSQDACIAVFRRKVCLLPVLLDFDQEARASNFNAPFPRFTPGFHQVAIFPAPGLLGGWVDLSPFLIRTSRKGTDVVTPLGLEKYGRIEFSIWKWVPMNQNALKSMSEYAKGSGTFDGTQFRSFFRSWQPVF